MKGEDNKWKEGKEKNVQQDDEQASKSISHEQAQPKLRETQNTPRASRSCTDRVQTIPT